MKKRRTKSRPAAAAPVPSTPPSQPIPLDQRLINEMQFGFNKCVPDSALPAMTSKTWEPSPAQIEEQAWVRNYLRGCNCVRAGDIEKLGCTGVVMHEMNAHTSSDEAVIAGAVAHGTRLRLGLAGSGVGLPCFVPPSRFCLMHNTIGGLEDGQTQYNDDFVEDISRPLTPEEEAKTKVMQHARKLKSVGEVNDFIAGKSPLEDVVEEQDEEAELSITRLGAPLWKCTEHTSTVWTCRYCLAQAIVEGSLEPQVRVLARFPDAAPVSTFQSAAYGADVAAALAHAAEEDYSGFYVVVQAARFTRKLSRD